MSISSSTTHDDSFVCECEDRMRSACLGEIFYKEHDGKRYCVLHYPGKEKVVEFKKALQRKLDDQDFDFAGVWFPDEVSFENFTFNAAASFNGAQFNADAYFSGAQFNAAAYFSGAQFNAAAYFIRAQFSADADFSDSKFSAAGYFSRAQFSADADFIRAQFGADAYFIDAQFGTTAYFYGAKFSTDAYFSRAQFSRDTSFIRAQFSADAYFIDAQFKHAYFSNAVFNANVHFQRTRFIGDTPRAVSANANNEPISSDDKAVVKAEITKVSFDGARFKDGVSFKDNRFADQVLLSFAAAVFEKPERVTFHTVSLRPHWFIDVDPRKFNFIHVNWGSLSKRDAISEEIHALESNRIIHARDLLEVTFRQLAVNAEENNRYEEAADFRYIAVNVRHMQGWLKLNLFRLSWWYWLLSGYGERVRRAFGALVSIWLLFAVIYWSGNATWWQPRQTGRIVSESSERDTQPTAVATPLTFPEALVYSVGVMALQKPEPLPANKRAKAFVIFETILGPLQAALLALAIRRKFMR